MSDSLPTLSPLNFFTSLAFGYMSESAIRSRYGYGLHLDPSGLARFSQIAGWLAGLDAGRSDLAAKLADDFDKTVKYACSGTAAVGEEVVDAHTGKAEGLVMVPPRKVVLYDDGTFGGFGVLWYRRVMNAERVEKARSFDEGAWSGDDDKDGSRWGAALAKADDALRIRKDLEEFRSYRPTWASEDSRHSSTVVWYGFDYNGGLLYHGPGGGEVFAVTLGDVRGWSLHT